MAKTIRFLKILQDQRPQVKGFGDGLHWHGKVLNIFIAKEICGRAGCDHKVIIRNFANGGIDGVFIRIYLCNFSIAETEVLLPGKIFPERKGNRICLKTADGNLV